MQSNRTLFFVIIGLALVSIVGMIIARSFLFTANPIEVSILYSTEKEAWLQEVIDDFDSQINGRPIKLTLKKMGSRELYKAVVDGAEQPDLISPASSLQISLLVDESAKLSGLPAVNATNCRSVVSTPLVLVAWQARADALGWLNSNDPDMWERLHDAVVDQAGWSAYGQPNWGFVKFAHTDPRKSNSGLLAVLLITYDYFNKSTGLTATDINSRDYEQWFSDMADFTTVGESTDTFVEEIIAFGPSKYDMVAIYEASAIKLAQNAADRHGELGIYYPPTTILSDHPFCILQTAWVTPEKAEAAQRFVDHLLSRPSQEKALALGFRPADSSISLTSPGSPFNSYVENGIQVNLPPEVEVPAGDVLETLLRFWDRVSR